MEQSDLDLLQTVPAYHLQSVLKVRHVPLSTKLQNIGSSSGPSATSPANPTTILEIAQHLFDPTSIHETLRALGETEVLILRELVACGGRANSRDLAFYFTSAGLLAPLRKNESEETYDSLLPPRNQSPASQIALPPLALLQPPQYPQAHPHGVFEQALRRLLVLGLVFWGKQTNFAGRDYPSGVHDGVLIVPLAIRDAIRSEWGPEKDTLAGFKGEDVGEGARRLQRTLYLYWSLVASQREGLALVSSGLLARAALRLVVDTIYYDNKGTEQREHVRPKNQSEQIRLESDAPHLLFIRLLLMKLGLLQERGNALYAAPAEPFFSLPLLERVHRCYHLYLDTPFWNEMHYLPEVNVRPGPTLFEPAHEEVMHARETVVERITHERVGEWCNLSAFIARCKLYAPYLLFPRQYGPRAERYSSGSNPYGWDFRLRRGWLTHREGWHMVEGGFIRAIVAGPLYWLGIVELEREEMPASFKLSSGSATIMSDTSSDAEEETWGRLIVQPNFELVALAPVSEALLVKLDRFADRINLEHIAQYRLTKASVTRAIQRGLHAEDIQSALETAAGGEIPQNVRYSVGEWERQARRIEVWQKAILLEVDDAALLDALFADQETRQYFGRRLAPQLVEVFPHQLAAVQQVLWQRDYLPALTAAPTQDAMAENGPLVIHEPQWRLHDDGLLQPFYAVLDLYLVSEVERFSIRDEATGWYRITPTSLQRALAAGVALEYIIRFLQQYCDGGIPGSLLIRLKLWGGGYGERHDIHVEHAPLLRLSEQVLKDLQTDDELKALLGTEVESQSRLIRVDASNLERVITLLRERGFTIE
ncbi:MAG TPA: helicase-associated domain-containing protein [Ktedonobacteraceae bacterium]|nr:helicase-associated domain-containing protein [Ktedonobacteraceae bacterium]